jgi:citrate lyase beta subunit
MNDDRGAADIALVARSWLFVPGDRSETMVERASQAGADVVVFDLEDAVAKTAKDAARAATALALARLPDDQAVAVRINGLDTPWWRTDLELAVTTRSAVVVVPKVRSTDEARLVVEAGASNGERQPSIVALIESAAGVVGAASIASAPGVVAIALGGEDLAADLGIERDEAEASLDHVRHHLVLAARAAGRAVIDTPVVAVHDDEAVQRRAVGARKAGMTGMFAIHPAQVASINSTFAPTEEQVQRARADLEAYEAAVRAGSGVAVVEGRMVDEALAAAARGTLRRRPAPPT